MAGPPLSLWKVERCVYAIPALGKRRCMGGPLAGVGTGPLPGTSQGVFGQHFHSRASACRWSAKKNASARQAIGRSRGGLTTKLHVCCIDEHSAIAMTLTEGQRHDSVPVPELLAQSNDHGQIARVTADRAYDGNPIRIPLQAQGIEAVIPAHPNRKDPPPHDVDQYKLRHKVENFFRKLFDFRRIATRYEKLANVFLALIQVASSVVILRCIR